jgi:hypothetical protein
MPRTPEPESPPLGPSAESKTLLAWTLTLFGLTFVGLFFASSFIIPEVEPGFPATEKVEVLPDGSFQITLGVRDRDKWVGLDMGSGAVVSDGTPADLRFRRYVIRAPGGATALGLAPLDLEELPPDLKWEYDVNVDGGLQNPAVARWYEYGLQSHLLTTKGETYVVRRSTGKGKAIFKIASYYCDPDGSGCLTIRYRLMP